MPAVLFPEIARAEEKFRTCIQCGVCSASCPMSDAMEYPPRQAVRRLLEGRFEEVVKSNTPWLCVSCHTCSSRCPSKLLISDGLFPALRAAVMESGGVIDQDLQMALHKTYLYGNALGEGPNKRADWAKTSGVPVPILGQIRRPVDVLWMVECYPSYDPRGQSLSRLLARILNALRVDFAILGREERCVGDCEWLAGERGLFEMLVERNIEILSKYQFKEVLFTDPHGYRSMVNIYPVLGGKYVATHYTQFLRERLDQIKPLLKKKVNATVTYHDSCCLGRKMGQYEDARILLKAIPGLKLVEMSPNRESALCCGGGGSTIHLDHFIQERVKDRLADRRVRQAAATGANVLAVACPFEPSRFEDGVKMTGLEGKIIVRDIVELLAESMELA
jgi:Fe-S oxidoreductase